MPSLMDIPHRGRIALTWRAQAATSSGFVDKDRGQRRTKTVLLVDTAPTRGSRQSGKRSPRITLYLPASAAYAETAYCLPRP